MHVWPVPDVDDVYGRIVGHVAVTTYVGDRRRVIPARDHGLHGARPEQVGNIEYWLVADRLLHITA